MSPFSLVSDNCVRARVRHVMRALNKKMSPQTTGRPSVSRIMRLDAIRFRRNPERCCPPLPLPLPFVSIPRRDIAR